MHNCITFVDRKVSQDRLRFHSVFKNLNRADFRFSTHSQLFGAGSAQNVKCFRTEIQGVSQKGTLFLSFTIYSNDSVNSQL